MSEESIIEKITLPKDWKTLPFGDVCEISGGSQPPKPTFIYEPKEGYVRLVQVRDYRTNNFTTYIPKEKAKKFCNKTDIMIGRYGPPIFGIFRGLEGAYNVALMKAIPNQELLNQEYLYWFLKTDSLVKFVEKSSKRAAGQDGVRKEVLYTYPTPIPPLPKQKQIVVILDKAFAAIDTAKANAEQNLQNAKELFESYLQNIFENKGDDWEEKTLAEVCDLIKRGSQPKYTENKDGEIVLNQKCIRDHKINFSHSRRHDLSIKSINEERYIQLGDGLINSTGTGTLGRVAQVRDLNQRAFVDTHITIVRPKKELFYLDFFGWALIYIEKIIEKSGEGASGQTELSRKLVEKLVVSFPKKIEQQKQIVLKLDSLSLETKKLESIYTKKLADLEEMKKSILQKAFSGQLSTIN